MATIQLKNLTKRYAARGEQPEQTVVDGIELEVGDGEFLVLVGPSGCGKSTTLRLIAGLDHPSEGTVLLGGRDLTAVAPPERDVAMVFQGYALYPHLNVEQNMGFALKMQGVKPPQRAERVRQIADTLGLSALLGRLPSELSGGERQRVAMGRAIVREPKVFLFDEPLSNLDAKLRAQLRVELAALVRRLGTTAVYVTHDQAEAMTMADRIAVMDKGRLLQLGTPREIYESPANRFVARFIGAPEINLLPVNDGKVCDVALPPSLLPRDSGLQLGVRPEHVLIGDAAGQGVAQATGTVEQAELHGAHTVVRLSVRGQTLRGRLQGFVDLAVGDEVPVAFDSAKLSFFDEATGERITENGA